MKLNIGCAFVGLFAQATVAKLPGFYSPPSQFDAMAMSTNSLSDSPTMNMTLLTERGLKILSQRLNTDAQDLLVKSSYQDSHNGVFHLYVVQLAYGLPVVNSDASLSLDASGNPLATSSAWTPITSDEKASLLKRQLGISASQAVVSLLKNLGKDMPIESLIETDIDERTVEVRGADVSLPGVITCKKNFYRTPESLEKAWAVNIQFRAHWYNAFVSMTDGKILGATDYVTAAAIPHSHDHDDEEEITFDKLMGNTGKNNHLDASYSGIVNALSGFELKGGLEKRQADAGVAKYNVYPLDPKKDVLPLSAGRESWHSFDNRLYTTTAGNNVIAQENIQDKANLLENYRPTAPNLNFNFIADDSKAPQASVDASITNCFVISNIFHDVVYRYGFTEQSGNFQMRPVGGQGRQGGDDDPVICAVQDSSSSNNANFATGPDGRPGIMRLSNFDRTTPNRDSGLESDIIFHELTHGMTNRLTGGPGNSNCMNSDIARGMGEGWSDSVAVVFRMTPNSQPNENYVVGGYATNNPALGIRRYAYSLDTNVNPLTYENVAQSQSSVHATGTIWATMLNEVYWNLVQKLGFSAQLSDARSGKGNTVFLQLLIDGMKLQPCNPNLIQARDAILQADQVNNGGANRCEIWRGFAKRGLGTGAAGNTFQNSQALPAGC